MLLFSTMIEIKKTMSRDEFIDLVIEWNRTSTHKENIIPNLIYDGRIPALYGTEDLWIEFRDCPELGTIAVRYEKIQDSGAVWDTDYIFNYEEGRLAIQLSRSYQEDALIYDGKFSAPYFISLLSEKGFTEPDNDLPVTDSPVYIDQGKIGLLADMINGRRQYRLPVVYVSKRWNGSDPLNAQSLAYNLKSVAHVLVQEDVSTTDEIRDACDGYNEYNGAVGIYYPNSTKEKFLSFRDSDDSQLFGKVVNRIIRYSNAQALDELYTWDGIRNQILRTELNRKRNELKESNDERDLARQEVENYIGAFDDDLRNLLDRIEELEKANNALRAENTGLRARINGQTEAAPMIYYGSESELYPGEIRDIVLEILNDYAGNVTDGSRRQDVLTDILRCNEYKALSKEKENEIRRILKAYSRMDKSTRQALSDWGFEINDDGKHYKMTYYGDSRYTEILGKTPSDGRGNLNSITDIIRKML